MIRQYGWQTFIGLCLLLWGVLITAPDAWLVALSHWPMALVMIGGSLVAGSTPMGGGTIAFPALVLGFKESPAMARDFGLAIQSIGMTSALLFIVMRGIPVERRMLTWSCIGAVIGLTLGTYLLAGRVPADWVKLLFATLWITFGGWLVTGTAKATSEPRPPTENANVVAFGLIVGVVGGAVASLIGVGVEMLVYATLVLRFGWGPKAAVPTAVCATALVSPVGLLLRAITAGIHPAVFPTWMACVPIVIFGAPAGAYISTRMPRRVLLGIIGVLVLVQFAVTVNQVRPSAALSGGVLALAALSGAGLWLLAPSERERTERQRGTFDLAERVSITPRPAPVDLSERLASEAPVTPLDLELPARPPARPPMPAGAAPDREPPRKTPAPTPELLVDEGSSHEALVRIQRIGIYHTALLVNRADEVFAPEVLDRLSERTRAEWRSAGRCLAFNLHTACGFHLLRAAESAMRDSDGASRVDSKAMALMIQIREHCGGEPLNAHQATVLFNLAQSAIVTLMTTAPSFANAAHNEWV